ncbi:MAG: DNA/RNA non-specific endonuclease [Bacteroides sp.]|nr:DNA/RNA non-specific endonuclease [Bacteroides sp.]
MTTKRNKRSSGPSKRAASKSTVTWKISRLALIVILLAACTYLGSRLEGHTQPARENTAGYTAFGDLMDVKTNPTLDEIRKSYVGMDISFNPRYHIPNWVSWELLADETDGTVTRSDRFTADPDIETSAETWDYNYSGYDRGHMAPAGDMRWDKEAMRQTFYMTNICPQAKSLNAGTWKNLEEKCRQWAAIDSAIYIVCGPVIDGNPIEYIGDTRVYVPRQFFKVIISPYANPPRGIGFIMPNEKPEGGMQRCAVPIDSVEAITGHDFFASLPDNLENDLESQCDFPYWSTYSKRKRNNNNK